MTGVRDASPASAPGPARPMHVLHAGTLQAMLAGFEAIGVDPTQLRRAANLPALNAAFDALVPAPAFEAVWRAAAEQRGDDGALATRVGLAVPFGAFSSVDYLAASSPSLSTAFASLSTWFKQVTPEFRVQVTTHDGEGLVELVPRAPFPAREVSDEFTVAVMVGRFRQATAAGVRPRRVRLSRPAPSEGGLQASLLGCEVSFGCSVSALEWDAAARHAPLRSADAALQKTLDALVRRLELGPDAGPLIAALRARLRDLLPDGETAADAAARALGLSARTLQRRLQDEGTSFREVVDRFREAESERLLLAARLAHGDIALRLGFSDQTAWNRAFRRWKHLSPTEWLATLTR